MRDYFAAALDNIVNFGDTDIFPYPIENQIIADKKAEMLDLLCGVQKDFQNKFDENPPSHLNLLAPVGVTGFRWASQLDPFWNAFLLGTVLSISQQIEETRIPTERQTVFSYRVAKEVIEGRIFRDDVTWRNFVSHSIELAKKANYVVVCDISDCYQRIPHHRLEKALNRNTGAQFSTKIVMSLLANFSHTRSYSVPVGGPAARILVEAVLNLSDQLLKSNQIKFARYADDYHLFVDSIDDAYKALVFISEKLLRNEGLALQKSKTRIMTASEFVTSQNILLQPDEDDVSSDIRNLFSLNLRYDPYSPTAEDDYEKLKKDIDGIDILGILNRELAKSRVQTTVARRIAKAIRYLEGSLLESAVLTLTRNIDSLYVVFPAISITIKECFCRLASSAREEICETLRKRILNGNFVVSNELHAAYAIRILAEHRSPENVDCLDHFGVARTRWF